MIKPLLFVLAGSCPTTKIINHTKVWSDRDQATLESTKTRCQVYYKESPCVKVFIKKEEQLYNVICGKAE